MGLHSKKSLEKCAFADDRVPSSCGDAMRLTGR